MAVIDASAFPADVPVGIVYPAYVKASYGVIRNLGERGIPVVALNPFRHPHMKSRWATPLVSPDLAEEPVAFFSFLARLSEQLPAGGILYLMEDVYVYLIHIYRDLLPANIHFPFLDEAALEMTLNKQTMLEVAERAGVPIPWTRYPKSLADLEAIRDELPFPCLIKPLVSRFTYGKKVPDIEPFPKAFHGKCAAARNYDELKALISRAVSLDIPVCVQEQLVGPNESIYTVHLYANAQHEILGAATGRKIRQLPADFGVGTYCEAARRDDAVPLAQALVKAVRFHGIAGVEFMADPKTGVLKLMEINPRGIHWMGLAAMVGVELPYLKYTDLLGKPERQIQRNYTLKWLDGRRDWQFLQTYGQDRSSPFYLPPWRWAASLMGATPSILNFRDPWPGLTGFIPAGAGQRVLALRAKLGPARHTAT